MSKTRKQYRPRLDPSLDQALDIVLNHERELARETGQRKPDFSSFISSELIKLNRKGRLEAVLDLHAPFPKIFSPPTDKDANAPRPSIYLDDPETINAIEQIARKAARPAPHIVYSLMRYIANVKIRRIQPEFRTKRVDA